MEKSTVRVMTLAVYFSYSESLVGYRNAQRSKPGIYRLELQRSGVSKDFVCIGRWACRRHPYIESLPTPDRYLKSKATECA